MISKLRVGTAAAAVWSYWWRWWRGGWWCWHKQASIEVVREDVEVYHNGDGYWCECHAWNDVTDPSKSSVPLSASSSRTVVHIACSLTLVCHLLFHHVACAAFYLYATWVVLKQTTFEAYEWTMTNNQNKNSTSRKPKTKRKNWTNNMHTIRSERIW